MKNDKKEDKEKIYEELIKESDEIVNGKPVEIKYPGRNRNTQNV